MTKVTKKKIKKRKVEKKQKQNDEIKKYWSIRKNYKRV